MQDDPKTSTPTQPVPEKRRRRWPIVLVLVLILVAVGAGIAWYQLGGKVKMTEPYKQALAQVRKNPQVIAQLGQPVHDVWLPASGSFFGENANVFFKVEGPKGQANVQAEARLFGGKWALQSVNVTFADMKRISIDVTSGGGGAEDAPKWTPSSGAAPKTTAQAPKTPPPASPGPDIQVDIPDLGSPQKAPAAASPAKK